MSAYAFEIPLRGGYPVLLEGGAAVVIQKSLARLLAREGCELAAYCYLPDRLIGVATGEGLEGALALFMGETSLELSRRKPPSAWGIATVKEVSDVEAASREALMTPVREGVARSALSYGHSGSLMYEVSRLLAV